MQTPTTTRKSTAVHQRVTGGDAEPGDGRGEEPPQRGPYADALGASEGVTVVDATGAVGPREREWLQEQGGLAVAALGARGAVRVRLVGDDEMASAHETYLGVPGTTDVITFDLSDGASASGAPLDVDLLVCVDEARRQAAARGIDGAREMLLYTVHGVLHALGHDDHDDGASRRMHGREDEVLEALGVGPTFALPARDETKPEGTSGR